MARVASILTMQTTFHLLQKTKMRSVEAKNEEIPFVKTHRRYKKKDVALSRLRRVAFPAIPLSRHQPSKN